MELRKDELREHRNVISKTLREICQVTSAEILIQETDLCTTSFGAPPLAREVRSDLDVREWALRLPIPDEARARFWIALHECWVAEGRRKARFKDCGVRIYTGEMDQEPVQFLRLEWVAPVSGADGEPEYHGGRAGHPHWHIDRTGLVDAQREALALISLLEPLDEEVELEEFTAQTTPSDRPSESAVQDFTWISSLHLPAQSMWALQGWDGRSVPAPHQSEPNTLKELTSWWTGALRYIASELRQLR